MRNHLEIALEDYPEFPPYDRLKHNERNLPDTLVAIRPAIGHILDIRYLSLRGVLDAV